MIVQCIKCRKFFEDVYRSTLCPHAAFPANDGRNVFTVHDGAYLNDKSPSDAVVPEEPLCPLGRLPHRERIKTIASKMLSMEVGSTAAICIDDTSEHLAYYLHELAKLPMLKVVFQGSLNKDIYTIKVERI